MVLLVGVPNLHCPASHPEHPAALRECALGRETIKDGLAFHPSRPAGGLTTRPRLATQSSLWKPDPGPARPGFLPRPQSRLLVS
jgi:hypothetical protein